MEELTRDYWAGHKGPDNYKKPFTFGFESFACVSFASAYDNNKVGSTRE